MKNKYGTSLRKPSLASRRYLLAVGILFFSTLLVTSASIQSKRVGATPVTESFPISDLVPDTVFDHINGSTSAGRCSYGSPLYVNSGNEDLFYLQTLDAEGIAESSLSRATNEDLFTSSECSFNTLADIDGTIYGELLKRNQSGAHKNYLVATKDDSLRWKTEIIMCANMGVQNETGRFHMPIFGHDGNIYVMVESNGGSLECQNQPSKIVSIDPRDGSVRFEIPMGDNSGDVNQGYYHQRVFAHTNGFIVLDGKDLKYFSYDGTQDSSATKVFTVDAQERVWYAASSPDGKVFARIRPVLGTTGTGECGGSYSKVYSIDLAGSQVRWGDQECAGYGTIHPTPDGGAILTRGYSRLMKYAADGSTLVYDKTVSPDKSGYAYWKVDQAPMVDSNGNVFVIATGREPYTNGDRDYHIIVYLYDNSGIRTKIFSTEAYDTHNLEERFARGNSQYSTPLDIGNGRITLTYCKTSYSYVKQCDSTVQNNLVRVSDNRIGTAYPDDHAIKSLLSQDIDSDGLTASLELTQGTDYRSADTDGDGLNDFIESTLNPNRDATFCGTECAYPDPVKKDIYIEVDWMTRPDNLSMKPTNNQLVPVSTAFAYEDINVHFDTGQYGGGNEVEYNEYVNIIPYSPASIYDYKHGSSYLNISSQFDLDNRHKVWRYLLVADKINNDSDAPDGIAWAGDDDSIIAYGQLWNREGATSIDFLNFDNGLSKIIMHELGHNICLTKNAVYSSQNPDCIFEGVEAAENFGNYISVMRRSLVYSTNPTVDYSNGTNGQDDHNDWAAILLGVKDFQMNNFGDEQLQ